MANSKTARVGDTAQNPTVTAPDLKHFAGSRQSFFPLSYGESDVFSVNEGLPVDALLQHASILIDLCERSWSDAAIAMDGPEGCRDLAAYRGAAWMASYTAQMAKALVDSALCGTYVGTRQAK
jgi:hypothetical protein